ncbi:hypothetical protein AB0K00_05775 [Dactylosporangium sp. NPDC049525]|uniref:hypothetical protein n=1 Tax=Dactylosporangium sp. NPDC049525 TaxID=3154730 RepID=UPI00343516BE
MLVGFVLNRYGALGLGVIAVLVGLLGFSTDKVTCGDRVMQPGGICNAGHRGDPATYDEMRFQNRVMRIGLVGGGTVLLSVGGVLIVRRRLGPPPQ